MEEELKRRLEELEQRVTTLEQKKRKAPRSVSSEIINPFSDQFLTTAWETWKKFKKEQHRFTYKGLISEQAALNELVEMSLGDEVVAFEIIKQSIAKGWQGLFPIKKTFNGQQQQTGAKSGIDDELLKQKLAARHAGRR
jgi:hypothetical protein